MRCRLLMIEAVSEGKIVSVLHTALERLGKDTGKYYLVESKVLETAPSA